MIYPISDSSWVSLVYVVPKKGGMTVVANEKKWINSYVDGDRVENVHWLQKTESGHEEISLPRTFHG